METKTKTYYFQNKDFSTSFYSYNLQGDLFENGLTNEYLFNTWMKKIAPISPAITGEKVANPTVSFLMATTSTRIK